ncbi:MAG: phosphoglucosamine mutase [Holosporaceae bacterium]|jgi:phosphoglucosamine mutase|nr:phosphoglucosamine mutase [Holosporaceae bacterium]
MRKLFGTDGIRGAANEYPMTIETCQKLAEAIVVKFCSPREKKHLVVMGRDTRVSGDMFSKAMAATFYSLGVNVCYESVVSTPHLSIKTAKLGASVGVMISASHNPFYDNGIKLFNESGLKLTEDEEAELEEIMSRKPSLPRATGADIGQEISGTAKDYFLYYKKIKRQFNFNDELAERVKIVVDCANGSLAAFFTKYTLNELGFENIVLINNSPDGTNINKNCGVTCPNVIGEAVLHNKADIGIAFDGDGDRVIISDENGKILDGDHILAILAASEKCDKVVSTIMSNFALEKYLSSVGIELIKTQVGDKYVSERMRETGAKFGAEPSGHVIVASHAYTGDGLFAALKVLEYMIKNRKKCGELRFFEPCPTVSKNIRVKDKSVVQDESVQRAIGKFAKQLEGRGKLIVRPSGTEPVVRICVEGEDVAELQNIADELSLIIENLRNG